MFVIRPRLLAPASIALDGFASRVALNALKTSQRSARFMPSRNLKFLCNDQSADAKPGPRKEFLPALPNKYKPGVVYAAGLNHSFRLCPPGTA